MSVDSPTNEGRNRRLLVIGAAAAVAVIGVTGIAVAVATSSGDDETQSPAAATTVAPATSVAPVTEESTVAAPVRVTACIDGGPYVGPPGTKESVEIPSPEGVIRLGRYRGDTYLQPWTEVSDPRLQGTYTRSWDEDEYFSGGAAFLSIVVTTDRIENDEGAWQGSGVWYRPAEGEASFAPMVMVGEGAYEGLTAILGFVGGYGECAVTGYILEGSIPAPPVPPSDQ